MVLELRAMFRSVALFVDKLVYTSLFKMDIAKTARISFGAKLDKTNPRGIHIGAEAYVASGAIVFSHDFARGIHADTYIGERCFIGANAIILPGIHVGNQCIVGGGSVVTKDVPDHCIVAGNPARIIRENIRTGKYGRLII